MARNMNIDAAAIRRFYDENGFLSFPDLLEADEIERLRAAFDECVADGRIRVDAEEIVNTNDAILLHPAFEGFCRDPRVIAVATALLGPDVELQHSKFINKPGQDTGKGEIKWHQDFPFFPHTNTDLLALAVHLDEEDETSGSVVVIPGSHTWGVLSHVRDGEFVYECTAPVDYDAHPQKLLTGPAGHVTVHHGLILHASARKTATRPRRVMYLQMRPVDAIQLSGVIWRCTGTLLSGRRTGLARFPDGSTLENRGVNGRLFDQFGLLAPDTGGPKHKITAG